MAISNIVALPFLGPEVSIYIGSSWAVLIFVTSTFVIAFHELFAPTLTSELTLPIKIVSFVMLTFGVTSSLPYVPDDEKLQATELSSIHCFFTLP